ncbi:MAG: peptidase rane alanine aminopeptidase [Myxococcales bacterium]|nr:peptidase rane alanine aminopeptidase [Myxococcales bacterium]
MARPLVIVVALGVLAMACGPDHGSVHVRPIPTIERTTPLRGGGPARSTRIASYKIDARLDVTRHLITASQTLTWTNPGETAVTTLPFHLYLNAFKNESTLFMRSGRGELRGEPSSSGGWGYVQIDSVQIGGVELLPKLAYVGGDETVAELALAEPVPPGGTIEVAFKFTAQLPEVFARTGYKGEFHMVGQWFPKIGVRTGTPGAERWECEPFHVNSEFFADFGVYDVTLTVPSTYVVAATGVLTAATEAPGGTRMFTYRAEDVHDFAWMADPYMDVMSGEAKVEDGTVEVRVYYRPAQHAFARRHLDAGIGAIEKFSAAFLPYPWPLMTIIDPPLDAANGAGGMEYPTLVTTGGDTVFARPGLRLPEYVTVHEVGHNWFQGMLASNEVVEGWLDEGVNDWADGKVMNEMYGARSSGIDWMGWQAEVAALRRAVSTDPGSLPSPIASAARAFVDNRAYGEATYAKAARALGTLEQTVGPIKFAAAMKAYARAWAFKHPTGRDLIETLSRELGEDLTWFFGPVFQRVGGIELGIRTAACHVAHPARGIFGDGSARRTVTEAEAPDTGAFLCEVVITNTGVVHVPVDIDLEFADGSTQRVHWDDRGAGTWERFVIPRSSRLVEVWIDPENKLALASPVTHHHRIEGDGAAALRAAAWVGSLSQTLMQIVGP